MATGYQVMGGVPSGYAELLNSARQQLVQLPDGTYAVSPQYGQPTTLDQIYGGILPSVPKASPGFTASTMAETRAEQARSAPKRGVGTSTLAPATKVQTVRIDPLTNQPIQTADSMGRYNPPLPTYDSAVRSERLPIDRTESAFLDAFYPSGGNAAVAAASALAGPPLPRPRPAPPLPTMPDPLLEEARAIGRTYEPSAKVKAALAAPPPPGSPGAPPARSGGLLGLLLGGGAGQPSGGLGALLGGGAPATGQQLANMQAAASLAQDPALAAALSQGRKGYVPTNGDPTGVLGSGALMPTVAMNGNPIRNR